MAASGREGRLQQEGLFSSHPLSSWVDRGDSGEKFLLWALYWPLSPSFFTYSNHEAAISTDLFHLGAKGATA